MKLSEAIRLGSMLKPQAFGKLYTGWLKGPAYGDVLGVRTAVGVSSCALGAALDAVGMLSVTAKAEDILKAFSVSDLYALAEKCPVCGGASESFPELNTVAHLNNHHRWTRERIAQWVETIEARYAQTDGVRELKKQPMEPAQATSAA